MNSNRKPSAPARHRGFLFNVLDVISRGATTQQTTKPTRRKCF